MEDVGHQLKSQIQGLNYVTIALLLQWAAHDLDAAKIAFDVDDVTIASLRSLGPQELMALSDSGEVLFSPRIKPDVFTRLHTIPDPSDRILLAGLASGPRASIIAG